MGMHCFASKVSIYVPEHAIKTKQCENLPTEGIYTLDWWIEIEALSGVGSKSYVKGGGGGREKRWKEGPNNPVVGRVWWEGRTEVTICIGPVVRALVIKLLSSLPAASQHGNSTGLKSRNAAEGDRDLRSSKDTERYWQSQNLLTKVIDLNRRVPRKDPC